jgi:hypothetical protein
VAGSLEPRAPAAGSEPRSRLLAVGGVAAAFVAVAIVLIIAVTGGDDDHKQISTEPPLVTTATGTTTEPQTQTQTTETVPTEPQATKPQAKAPPVPAAKPPATASRALDCAPILGNGAPYPVRSLSSTQPEPCQSAREVVLQALNSGATQVGEWSCQRQPRAGVLVRCSAGDRSVVVTG